MKLTQYCIEFDFYDKVRNFYTRQIIDKISIGTTTALFAFTIRLFKTSEMSIMKTYVNQCRVKDQGLFNYIYIYIF